MGAFLDKPRTDKKNEEGHGNGLHYGLASMQGWRIEMEDAHCAVTGIPGELHIWKDWSFFAVFDGHAGASVSTHCALHMLKNIVQTEEFRRGSAKEFPSVEDVKRGILSGFLDLDDKMRKIPELASGEDKSGSTAVCSFISPKHIFIANCGDSRSILCREGKVAFTTMDHKPINPLEKERIQKAGGSVMIQRVNGSLAVSRALGDFEYKNVEGKGPCEQLVSPEPEIFVEKRDMLKDEFLVLACDGVWDVFSNQDLCDFIKSRLKITDSLASVCNQVLDTCLYKGSRDNISVVLVKFPAGPAPSAECIEKERQLEIAIENRMKELIQRDDCKDFPIILQIMVDEQIPGLPPGGGLFAKRTFMEDVFRRLCPNKGDTVGNFF